MNPIQTRFYFLILLVALLIRIAAAIGWQPSASPDLASEPAQIGVGESLFRLGDSYSYWALAENIARGEPYQYGSENARIFRTPLFPLLLAPLTLIPDPQSSVMVARIVCCLLGTWAVARLMSLATRLAGVRAGLVAGAMAAVYPSAIGMSIVILSEALFMPLMLLQLNWWQSAWSAEDLSRRRWQAFLSGCFAGLAVLTRPSWLLFLPFSLAAGLMVGKSRGRHLDIFICSALGLALIMSPWWVRNAAITGRFVPTTLQVGPSLYDSLHPGATGASDEGMAFMHDIIQEQMEADRVATEPLPSTFEYRLNRRAAQSAVRWAVEHPGQVARLAGNKFLHTWSIWPDGGDIASPLIRLAITLGTFSVVILAVVGSLLAGRPFRWQIGIVWMPCIYFTLLHMVFVGSIRYREPGVFVLIALAGCALTWLAGSRRIPIGSRELGVTQPVQQGAIAENHPPPTASS